MKRLLATAAVVCSFVLGGEASANDDVMKLTQDPNQWVLQTGDYANTRYSKLDQINADNVKNLLALCAARRRRRRSRAPPCRRPTPPRR